MLSPPWILTSSQSRWHDPSTLPLLNHFVRSTVLWRVNDHDSDLSPQQELGRVARAWHLASSFELIFTVPFQETLILLYLNSFYSKISTRNATNLNRMNEPGPSSIRRWAMGIRGLEKSGFNQPCLQMPPANLKKFPELNRLNYGLMIMDARRAHRMSMNVASPLCKVGVSFWNRHEIKYTMKCQCQCLAIKRSMA